MLVISSAFPNRYKSYAGIHVARQVELLEQAGVHVRVLAPRDSREHRFWRIAKYVRLVGQCLSALMTPIDIVHAHWPFPSGLIGLVIARLRRVPFVLTSHGSFVDGFSQRSRLVQLAVRRVLRGANAVIAVSAAHADAVAVVAGLPRERIECIDMGIVVRETSSRDAARRQLQLPARDSIVLFIGNLRVEKGPDVLARAVNRLHSDGMEFTVVIGGVGPLEKQVRSLLGQALPRTRFIGPVTPEDVATWLTAADVCVVPSRREGFGLLALEAMACGTIVVASDAGGLRDSVKDSVNGLVFPAEDHVALSERIRVALTDHYLTAALRTRARQTAYAYDARDRAARVIGIYDRLRQ